MYNNCPSWVADLTMWFVNRWLYQPQTLTILVLASIQGPDYMVRTAKKTMLDELEAMLEVVNPQPPGKQRSLSRRKFDLPEGGAVPGEKADGVNKAVRIIQEDK